MEGFETFCISDAGEGVVLRGIPSLEAARSIVADFYRRDAAWNDFLGETDPEERVLIEQTDDGLFFCFKSGFHFGSIEVERRCGCCRRTIGHRAIGAQL